MTIAKVKGFMTKRIQSEPCDLYNIKVKIKNGNVYSRSPFSLEARNELLAQLHRNDMKLLLCCSWNKIPNPSRGTSSDEVIAKANARVERERRHAKQKAAYEIVQAIDAQLPAEYHDDDWDEIPF